jgi:hypothetical protein
VHLDQRFLDVGDVLGFKHGTRDGSFIIGKLGR